MKLTALAIGCALLAAGCGSGSGSTAGPASATPSPTPETRQMLGAVKLKATGTASSTCAGSGGYSDLRGGTSVTVYDEVGAIIGAESLQEGTQAVRGICRFAFSVVGLPVRPFYQVEVAHRGKVTVRAEDLQNVQLSIGS